MCTSQNLLVLTLKMTHYKLTFIQTLIKSYFYFIHGYKKITGVHTHQQRLPEFKLQVF